jgi:hypothetical protein
MHGSALSFDRFLEVPLPPIGPQVGCDVVEGPIALEQAAIMLYGETDFDESTDSFVGGGSGEGEGVGEGVDGHPVGLIKESADLGCGRGDDAIDSVGDGGLEQVIAVEDFWNRVSGY